VVDAGSNGATISARQFGTNLGNWFNVDFGGIGNIATQVKRIGVQIVRWPGGSKADGYHWLGAQYLNYLNVLNGSIAAPNSSGCEGSTIYDVGFTFDRFMNDVVTAGNLEAALTVNYGSNLTCNGGGDPKEAAAWVAYAKAKGYNTHYWTVGNEVYGSWEQDQHAVKNDATTYGQAMAGPNGYYQLMKAADATAQVGVVVIGDSRPGDTWQCNNNCSSNTDLTMLANAQYQGKPQFDYVEFHWYAQQPNNESDTYLLKQAPIDFANEISSLRSELGNAGLDPATMPVMLGEVNSVAYNPGKQTSSIVNALFTGMIFGEIFKNNIAVSTWWFGYGGNQNCGNNNSSSLYGFQNFGGYDQIAANTQYSWNGCNSGLQVPEGTIFPTGNAAYLASQFATAGNHVLTTTVSNTLTNVKAYAATQASGYSLMLFNLDNASSANITLNVQNATRSSFTASTLTYGKAQYDDSANNIWTGPVSQSLGSVGNMVAVTLPPWSITVVKLQ